MLRPAGFGSSIQGWICNPTSLAAVRRRRRLERPTSGAWFVATRTLAALVREWLVRGRRPTRCAVVSKRMAWCGPSMRIMTARS